MPPRLDTVSLAWRRGRRLARAPRGVQLSIVVLANWNHKGLSIPLGCLLWACNAGHNAPPHPPAAKPTPTASKPPSSEHTTAAAPEASASASPAPEVPTIDRPASEPAAPASEAPAPNANAAAPRPEIHFEDHYPDAQKVRLLAWKKAHHATGPTFDQECWELGVRVGVPVATGLLCLVESEHPPFTLARVYRLEGARLREVWSATVRTWANWLSLTPLLSEDGATLTLHDRSPRACRRALREAHAKAEANKAPPSYELLGPACDAVGDYTFERGKYRLSSPPVESDPFAGLTGPPGLVQ